MKSVPNKASVMGLNLAETAFPKQVRRSVKVAIVVTLSFFVASCANIPHYTEPAQGEVAKIRIKNLQGDAYYMFVNAVDPAKCTVTSFVGHLNGGSEVDARRVGMLDPEEVKEGVLERRVGAGQPISFVPFVWPKLNAFEILTGAGWSRDAVRSAQSATCWTPIFVPKSGEEYELLLRPRPDKCTVSLFRLELNPGGQVVRTEVALSNPQFAARHPAFNSPPVCKSE